MTSGFAFLHPWWILAGFAVVFLHLAARRRPAPAIRVSATTVEATSPRRSFDPSLLEVLGLIGLACAVARPVGREIVEDPARGIEIALVTDVSSSMLAKDLSEGKTRLDVAKEAAARFVASRGNDRVALVTFARHPDLACPPTRDHGALGRMLQATATVRADGPEDATGIGFATAFACDVLRRRGDGARVVVLLSDGEENVATTLAKDAVTPYQAGVAAAALGIRVHTVAVGGGSRAADGSSRPLDTTELQRIAELTGGLFFRASDAAALDEVYARLDALEPTRAGTPRVVLREWFLAFLLPGLLLWCVGRIVSSTSKGVVP